MAKKSMIAKAARTPKHPTQAHRRCNRCGRPQRLQREYFRTLKRGSRLALAIKDFFATTQCSLLVL